jgi:tyrosyl-tRNA synthetase
MLRCQLQVGGATGLIGDPSGRSTERTMLTPHDMERNVSGISCNLSSFLKFSTSHAAQSASSHGHTSDALLLNNYDWHRSVSAIEFLRDIGKHFRVGVMLSKDSVKKYATTLAERSPCLVCHGLTACLVHALFLREFRARM